MFFMESVFDKFLRYIAIDTASDPERFTAQHTETAGTFQTAG